VITLQLFLDLDLIASFKGSLEGELRRRVAAVLQAGLVVVLSAERGVETRNQELRQLLAWVARARATATLLASVVAKLSVTRSTWLVSACPLHLVRVRTFVNVHGTAAATDSNQHMQVSSSGVAQAMR